MGRIELKIPQYRSTEPLTARQPPQVNPSVYSLPARAGIGLGEAISGAGSILMDQEIKIKEGKRKVEQALALQSGIDEYRTRMDDFDLNLQKMPDKSKYADQVRKGSAEIQNDIFKKIKDTKVQDALKIKFSDLGTDYYIKARDYENKYFISTKTGEALEKLDSISKRAGMAPSIEETIRVGSEGIRLIDELTGTAFSPEEASKMKIKLSDEIEKERLKTTISTADMEIFQNPSMAGPILQKPEYSIIPVDKQVALLKKGITEANRVEKKTKDDTDNFSEQMYGDLNARIRKGEDVTDLIDTYGPAGNRMLTKSNFDSLLKDIEALKKGGMKSDDDVLRDVAIRSNASVPRISEGEINDLMRSRKLSIEDGAKALDQIRTTNRSLKNEGETENNQRYSDAEKHIARGMGVSGLVLQLAEKIDPTQQGLITRALDELWRRSKGRGGKEDSMAVAREILPQYQKALKGQNLLSIETYKKIIDFDKYPTKETLLKDKKNISEADYYRKAKAFTEIQEKENLQVQLDALKSTEEFGR